ncbi:Uncharacterized protein TPAR_05803 [Tolypocladium paradoxum]|uniref:Wings apart-like protein C-terminal domain-containing protein n=1 Tax=Tolypocladium paradoxum TaxID=94208 RepID=A0A2S4KUX5_9HYPO|nr:Uncharacterized protein TPAR_05803 [Tolypocladium paradoxum]
MASRPPSKNAGHKKLVTYGSSSRRRHWNPKATQELDAPGLDLPQKPQSHGTSKAPDPSLDADGSPRVSRTSSDGRTTEVKGHAPEQQGDRKRKRNHSAAYAMKPALHHRANLGDEPKAAIDTPQRALERAYHGNTEGRRQASKTKTATSNASSSTAQRRSTAKDEAGTDAREKRASTVPAHGMPSTSRRRRLIDALAAQRATSPDEDAKHADDEVGESTGEEVGPSLPRPAMASQDARTRAADRRGATPTSRKIKFTYSQSRSALSESQTANDADTPGLDADDDTALSDTQALSSPVVPAFADEGVEDDDGNPRPAIKSVHELRRAGANNRFADEMDDLLARIGNPGAGSLTMRRNALCELAYQLRKESFAGQFRDHASRDNVAKGIGREEDVVSSFALAAALVVFLKSGPAPHLLHQLCKEGLGKLLGRLLRVSEDIDAVAAQRQTNLPRTTRASLHKVKGTLVQMPIWHELEPARLSPRTLGLQLLESVSRCSEGELLAQVVAELEADVVSVAADCAEAGAEADVDYALVVFALELLSSAGITPGANDQEAWTAQHPGSIAKFLGRGLQRWPEQRGELAAATLKLAINTTNTARGAAAFDNAGLLSLLTDRIVEGFRRVHDAIGGEGRLHDDLYDGLLLILGVTINIVEHCPPARVSAGAKALDELVTLWQENQLAVSEVRMDGRSVALVSAGRFANVHGQADSVDKSKVSVAVGYLAVLLGYLCLTAAGRERVDARGGSGEGICSLVGSIRDFVAMYKTVDSKVHELEALVGELRRHARRAGEEPRRAVSLQQSRGCGEAWWNSTVPWVPYPPTSIHAPRRRLHHDLTSSQPPVVSIGRQPHAPDITNAAHCTLRLATRPNRNAGSEAAAIVVGDSECRRPLPSSHRASAPRAAPQRLQMPSPKQRKVAIVGSRSVGKSSLAVQFVDGHFVDSYYPTIENTFSKTIRHKGQDFSTEIVDTAGQDEYSILNSKHFIGIHGYMLVYSVSSLPSFEMVQVIREKILNHLGTESVPIVIVGNKSDLRPEQRQVSPEEGKKLSEKFQCGWTEASARYNENVARAFELLIAQIEKSQNPGEPPEKSNCRLM